MSDIPPRAYVHTTSNRYGFVFQDSDPTFNAGVYGVNFDLWRSRQLHEEVQYWMEEVSQLISSGGGGLP